MYRKPINLGQYTCIWDMGYHAMLYMYVDKNKT